jgi:hypothetical protein
LTIPLDGGKALAKAVRDVFGELAVIARCRTHYAEQRIMPSWAREALWDKGFVLRDSA